MDSGADARSVRCNRHKFCQAVAGERRPKELYELGADPKEPNNRLADPAAKAALTFLLAQGRSAAGGAGHTR